jgi:Polyketide cyclase / dehydrase and lipid transport
MFSQLLYRGPSMDVLHERYAKQGHIDDQAPVTASYQINIGAPVRRVWELLSNPAGWPAFDPGIRSVQADVIAPDARFTWTNGRSRIKSQFAVIDPGREITWTGISSGFKVVHRHLLSATADGGTQIQCEESMAGPLLPLFYNSTKLHAALQKWLTTIKTAAEQ